MTEVNAVQESAPTVEAPVADLEKARETERNRFTREESLRRELDDAKSKLSSIKKNGWDLDVITSKPREVVSSVAEPDLKRELQELKEEIAREKSQRNDIDELQSILDFTRKNSQYELIRNLDDAPKFVQQAMREHYKNTGKHISYAEACDFVENPGRQLTHQITVAIVRRRRRWILSVLRLLLLCNFGESFFRRATLEVEIGRAHV